MYTVGGTGVTKKKTLYTTHGARQNIKSAKAGGRTKVTQ
jgi:hypothetical protein